MGLASQLIYIELVTDRNFKKRGVKKPAFFATSEYKRQIGILRLKLLGFQRVMI